MFVNRSFGIPPEHEYFCSEDCVQDVSADDQYRLIDVGDILEAEELAYQQDAKLTRSFLLVDEYYGHNHNVTFVDLEKDNTPFDNWVVIGQNVKKSLFLVAPWTGDKDSPLLKDDPERSVLLFPIAAECVWEEHYIDYLEYVAVKPLDEMRAPHTIYVFTGMTDWRSLEELNVLRDTRKCKLLPGEATKIRKSTPNFANI